LKRNLFHPVYHSHTYLAGSRVDVEIELDAELDDSDEEDLIDLFSQPPQFFERLSPVTTQIGDATINGRNWTDMMIQCYRSFGRIFTRVTGFLRQSLVNNCGETSMVPFMSISVDPDTLERLIEHDYEIGDTSYSKLIELFETGVVSPAITVPFHPVLPLLPSDFDRRLCIRLGMMFFAPILRAYQRYLRTIGEEQMTVAFWAPEGLASAEIVAMVREEFLAMCSREKFRKPHLVMLLDADLVTDQPLDRLMKVWCRLEMNGSPQRDVSVVFRDRAFSNWVTTSHPSVKKMIDRTIAKVDGGLNERGVDYTWSHFESLEALSYTPRGAVNFEQRILKLCEMGFVSVAPETFVRRKRNGRFAARRDEPTATTVRWPDPQADALGDATAFGRWRGWAWSTSNGKLAPVVMPDVGYKRRLARGTRRCAGSPSWKVAWGMARDTCHRAIGGDPDTMAGGVLGVLGEMTGSPDVDTRRRNVERFLVDYGLVYWREHFIQHDLGEADIRIDEIAQRALCHGTRRRLSAREAAAAGCAAQAYFFLLDSCNSYAMDADNLDQRALFQNVVMLTLALCNAVAVHHYTGDASAGDALVDLLEAELFDFQSAYERHGLEAFGVTRSDWDEALVSEVPDSKRNVVERAARHAARRLSDLGYADRVAPRGVETTTNVGHNWNNEMDMPNYTWGNPLFCGVDEA